MIIEYRRYEVVPGMLGKLHNRFEHESVPLWEEHGIQPIGFWEAAVGTSNEVHYMLKWDDMATRESRWDAFQGDPRWLECRQATEKDGPLIAKATNALWRPTSYSPNK